MSPAPHTASARWRRRASGLAWGLAWAVTLATTLAHAEPALPGFEAVRAAWRPSDVPLLDRHGQVLQTWRVDPQARRLAWVPLEDVSPALLTALVHSEDRRFWQHSGVDWAALARSAWRSALDQRTQGGSTLTMQLAGLMDAELARPAGGRSVAGKLGQLARARELEAAWTKSQIFEAYLNQVPWRGEQVGVNAAAQTLFGKHPSGLDAQEAALMAALVRAPNAAEARVVERACTLLQQLAALPSGAALASPASGSATVPPPAGAPHPACAGLATRAAVAFARRGERPLGEQLAPHAARLLWQQWRTAATAPAAARPHRPAALASSLDARVQRLALGALREQLAELQGREVRDGAVLVLDNATGEVLAWVGSPGELGPAASRRAVDVDAVLARRQPGSTLKPFVYGLAFERRLITPASLLHDAPAQLAAGGGGLYLPQNYDRQHHGWVSARTALASSLNVPAVQVGAMLGPDALFERLNAFGLRISHSGGFHGHALALGSAEVTLADLTNAYRALANQGRWSAWRLQAAPAATAGAAATAAKAPARQAADPAAVHLVSQILSDNSARALTFGFDSPLITRGFAAVKTGTSKDLRDNWCIGYTSRYTVGVWVGNADGSPMRQVSGSSGAAPVWRSLVSQLHAADPSRPPAVPAGVHLALLSTAGEAPRSEWFIAGTEPPDIGPQGGRAGAPEAGAARPAPSAQPGQAFGIHSPISGSLFALDPDIPAPAQRIVFSGAAGDWYLDGRWIGRTTASRPTLDWAPWPGRHRLSLRQQERELHSVVFEVRGAQARVRGAQARAGMSRPEREGPAAAPRNARITPL